MRKAHWEKNIFELIRRTSVDLPTDGENAIRRSTEATAASGSNWTGVVLGKMKAPRSVSRSRYDRPKVSPEKTHPLPWSKMQ